MARLKEYYSKEVAPALMSKFSYKSTMQIPKLDKIVINVGAGEAKDNSKVIDAICTDLSAITGQKPLICKARKSVANFKLREGRAIGSGHRCQGYTERRDHVRVPRQTVQRCSSPCS